MKLNKLLLTALTAGAFIGASLPSNAQITFTVDPGQTWSGYVNAFELDGTTFATGFPDATADLRANFAGSDLLLQPNTRLYDTVVGDAFWVDQITFEANKVIEANMYQERIDDAQIGQSVSFYFNTIANNLPVGYEAVGFIKVLDAFGTWATTQITTTPLVAGQDWVLTIPEVFDPGDGTASVQAGFYLKGVAVTASSPTADTFVQIVPEPTTFALAGLGAAALLVFRRRS